MKKPSKVSSLDLTRQSLEEALCEWALVNEGIIAREYINVILESGHIIDALNLVAASMQIKNDSFKKNSSCIVWTAWMNFQAFGTPGFPLNHPNPM